MSSEQLVAQLHTLPRVCARTTLPQRRRVAKYALVAWCDGWRGDEWIDEVAYRCETDPEVKFGPVAIWLLLNLALPLLLKWLIDNWTGQEEPPAC